MNKIIKIIKKSFTFLIFPFALILGTLIVSCNKKQPSNQEFKAIPLEMLDIRPDTVLSTIYNGAEQICGLSKGFTNQDLLDKGYNFLDVPDNVISIASLAFANFSSITRINLNLVIHLNTDSFSGCCNITKLDVSEHNSEILLIDSYTGVPTTSTSNGFFVEKLEWLNKNIIGICYKLVISDISGLINELRYCEGTIACGEIIIPNDILKIYSLSFYSCSSIISLDILGSSTIGNNYSNDFTADNIHHVWRSGERIDQRGLTFSKCINLKSINLGLVSEIVADNHLGSFCSNFGKCPNISLMKLDPNNSSYVFIVKASSGNFESYETNSGFLIKRSEIGNNYLGISGYTGNDDFAELACGSISFPDNVTYCYLDFSSSYSVNSIDLNGLETIENVAFCDCPNIRFAEKSPSNDRYCMVSGDGKIDNNQILNNGFVMMKDAFFSNHSIRGICDAFYGTENTIAFGSIRIPNETRDIYRLAFQYCTGITSLNCSMDTSQIGQIEHYAFSGCTNLKIVDLNTAKKVFEYAFDNCTNLQLINLSSVDDFASTSFSHLPNLKYILGRYNNTASLIGETDTFYHINANGIVHNNDEDENALPSIDLLSELTSMGLPAGWHVG